jgi:trk system potassium uptake protein TrkA
MIPLRTKGTDPSSETQEATHYILGGATVGIALAKQLQAAGHRVAIVDDSYDSPEIPGFEGDPATVDVLVESGVETAATVIAATGSDRRNLLIAQLVRTRFDVPRVVAFVHDPDRIPLFEDAGHEPFCVTTALAEACGETV